MLFSHVELSHASFQVERFRQWCPSCSGGWRNSPGSPRWWSIESPRERALGLPLFWDNNPYFGDNFGDDNPYKWNILFVTMIHFGNNNPNWEITFPKLIHPFLERKFPTQKGRRFFWYDKEKIPLTMVRSLPCLGCKDSSITSQGGIVGYVLFFSPVPWALRRGFS